MTKEVIFSCILCLVFLVPIKTFSQEVMPSKRFSRGKISAPELSEISGIISSINNPGMFWVHNDSGDEANIYLIDSISELKATYRLEGIQAVDIEDIAWVELNGISHIVLADIGDNLAQRKNITLYVFPEPTFRSNLSIDTIARAGIKVKTLNFSGKARDAEAIFVDPLDKRFYLISKREFNSTLYSAAIFESDSAHLTLNPINSFPFTFITGADISPKRDALVMKNLTSIYYWPLTKNVSIGEALAKNYTNVSYDPEPQGEAITFDRFTNGFYTISEKPFGLESYLYYYQITKP